MEINIDDLTIGQVKILNSLIKNKDDSTKSSILDDAIGRYVIVRSHNEGINAGVVVAADETGIVLEDARRIWYHKPKDSSVSWYEGVAKTGLHPLSKISCPVDKKYIVEEYSITYCTDEASKSIIGAMSHAS